MVQIPFLTSDIPGPVSILHRSDCLNYCNSCTLVGSHYIGFVSAVGCIAFEFVAAAVGRTACGHIVVPLSPPPPNYPYNYCYCSVAVHLHSFDNFDLVHSYLDFDCHHYIGFD